MLTSWINLNGAMRDDFRINVMTKAWNYLPSASHELKKYAQQVFTNHLHVNGFRPKSLLQAPIAKVSMSLLNTMQQVPEVMATVICLWGESEQKTINFLEATANDAGLYFQPNWNWQSAKNGFFSLDDDSALLQVAKSVRDEEIDSDSFILAAYWLAPALLDETITDREIPTTIEIDTSKNHLESAHPLQVPEMRTQTITEMYQDLKTRINDWQQAQECVQENARNFHASMQAEDIPQTALMVNALHEAVSVWQQSDVGLANMIPVTVEFLARNIDSRIDIDTDNLIRDSLQKNTQIGSNSKKHIDTLVRVAEQIMIYDQQRRSLFSNLNEVIERIKSLQHELKPFISEQNKYSLVPELHVEEIDTTPTLNARLRVLIAYQRHLETQLSQIRAELCEKITQTTHELIDDGMELSTLIQEGLTLGQLQVNDFGSMSLSTLQELKLTLIRVLDEQRQEHRQLSLEPLIALQESLNTKTLTIALEQLAKEKCDFEALLLIVSANFADPDLSAIELNSYIIDALIRGMEQIPTTSPTFSTLNVFAPYIFKKWIPTDSFTAAKLCMLLLAADYSPLQRLPKGFFWELPIIQWPIAEMICWNQLWEMVLNEESLPSLTSDRDAYNKLASARSEAHAEMQHENNGIFLKAHSVKSKRHINLLNTQLMPYLADKLSQMDQLEASNTQVTSEILNRHIARTEQDVQAVMDTISDEQLRELYENKASQEGVKDTEPFHKRTCLKIMSECAEGIRDYGEAMLNLIQTRVKRGHNLTEDKLLAELNAFPELQAIGQQIIQHFNNVENKDVLSEWNEEVSYNLAAQLLLSEILGNKNYALRLPRLVGELVNDALEMSQWLPIVLEDLTTPLDVTQIADLFVEKQASMQLLHLVSHLPVELQKKAQSLHGEKQRLIESLEDNLLKENGNADNLRLDRELGRWGFVQSRFEFLLRQVNSAHQDESKQIRQRARNIVNDIHRVEDEIFDLGSSIPIDVKTLIHQGLEIVRRAANEMKIFEESEEYLRDVQYRIDHQSWRLPELQASIHHLENTMVDNSSVHKQARTAEEVLDLLERNELLALGLNTNEISPSEIGTRTDLLHNWLAVRNIQKFNTQHLSHNEQLSIQQLYRFFCQMVSMRYKKTSSGEVLTGNDSTMYEYRELIYPQTSALDKTGVLVTLPGNPRKYISDLEQLIESKDWLSDYFVFVFIPGCTPEIRKRLETNHRKQGLVIIDEAVILEMILANAEGKKPVGSLRSQMLNAIETEGVDIFKVNQLVHPRTSIFVGRDSLVNSIGSTGKNYALYGGRRIGKSSVLAAVKNRLEKDGRKIILHSFEGDSDCSDNACAARLAKLVNPESKVRTIDEFKMSLQTYMDSMPDLHLIFLLDEIDRYISENPQRHLLIESLRTLSERYPGQLRLIVAGFMGLYDCLEGRGPYTPTSDPWQRMFDTVNLGNLQADAAEEIVKDGFSNILGWHFKNRAIPQRVVEYTGGHPAFVQKFCLNLQTLVGHRGDKTIQLEDLQAVFNDSDPATSFIAYVRKTLELNLDAVGRYMTIWLAKEVTGARGFTFGQMREYANLCKTTTIPEKAIKRSLDRLSATGVVRLRGGQNYEFSVPDYPMILDRLGDTLLLDQLEEEIAIDIEGNNA